MIKAGQRVTMKFNGILGVKKDGDCEGVFDCSPRSSGARYYAAEAADILRVVSERVNSIGAYTYLEVIFDDGSLRWRSPCYLEVLFDDGRRGFIDPGEVNATV
jgi:hypothetical protein